MIEIIATRELRYSTIEDVPIEKKEIVKDPKYCKIIDNMYKDIRRKINELLKKKDKSEWKKIADNYDISFLDELISVWKKHVFEKNKMFSKNDLGTEEEKQLLFETLLEQDVQKEIEEYFIRILL